MELARFPSLGGFSVRSILTFVLAVLVTVLLWAILIPTTTHAATEATWNGDTILFDGKVYQKAPNEFSTSHGLPEGTAIYVYYSPNNIEAAAKEAWFIYFASGTDPPSATSAEFVKYDYDAGDKTFSNPKDRQDIVMTPEGQESTYSSCTVTGGLGWIICPVTVFLADSMDTLFGFIASFLVVQPLTVTGTDNGLYTAWNVMRNIANIAFVIAFLLIIYSQLTNTGLTNYSLKKIIPRLVIAAVLVNISFIISAVAVDISNIIGYSLQDVLETIRKDVFHISDNTLGDGMNSGWSVVAAAILGGGGAVVGTIYAVSSGAVYLLVPLLVLLVLTALLVLIVLAARQAIIIVLIIIAPLAFVANLLPNTEKWFGKWRDLFMTMLIFFPAFSLVFGGAQLAGQIIIMNAGDNLIMVLFGMAVQVAPLVITPLLLRLSGNLLGRIAQIANNPSKGFLDRNKKWAQDRAELRRQKSVAGGFSGRNPARWGAGMVRANDYRRRNLQSKLDTAKQRAENSYHKSGAYHDLHEDAHDAQLQKEAIENTNKAQILRHANTKGSRLNISTLEVENAKVAVERGTAESGHMLSAYRAGIYDTSGEQHLADLQRRMSENVIRTAAWKQGEQNNQYVQQRGISERMRTDQSLLDIAQGNGTPELLTIGRERAQANAVATLTKLNKDARDNVITLMETEAVEAEMSVKDYAIKNIVAKAASGDHTVRARISRNQLEAALEIAASDGQVTVFDDMRANEYVDQTVVDAVVARNVNTMKAKGGFHIQADPKLSLQRYLAEFNSGNHSKGSTEEEVRNAFLRDQSIARIETLSNTTAENLGGMKYGAFAKFYSDIVKPDANGNTLLDVIRTSNGVPVDADGNVDENMVATLEKIYESFHEGLSDPSTRATMTDRLAFAREIEEKVRTKFFPGRPAPDMPETVRQIPTEPVDTTAGSPTEASSN